MTVRNTETFVGYDTTSNPNVKTAASNGQPNQMWAFVGNPFSGFSIINASNTSLTLGYQADPEGMNLSADNTIKWFPQASSNRENGFYLANSETGKRPNHRTASGLLLNWDGADAGSTFVVEEPRVAVNYIIKYNGTEVARAEGVGASLDAASELPAAYKRDYCSYEYSP